MKIIFMGTPQFAIPPLQALYEAGHDIVAIYAQPPRAKGRGFVIQKNPTHIWAEEHNIPVFTPTTLKSDEELEHFKSHQADIAVVVAYGMILPQSILDVPPLGCVNIHGSLLPKWRGAAPIQRAIMSGDKKTGITTMKMDAGLDTGPILEMAEVEITSFDTTQTLMNTLSDLGAKLIVSTLEKISTLKAIPQSTEGVTYAQKLSKSEGFLDFNKRASVLDAEIRGLTPIVSVWYEPLAFKIIKATPRDVRFDIPLGAYLVQDQRIYIQCLESVLEVLELQKEGGKPMAVTEFLKSYKGENHA